MSLAIGRKVIEINKDPFKIGTIIEHKEFPSLYYVIVSAKEYKEFNRIGDRDREENDLEIHIKYLGEYRNDYGTIKKATFDQHFQIKQS